MRLRTEMVDFHGRMLPRTGAHVAHFPLEHDAACAHALMLAIGEVRGYYPESVFPESGNSLDCKSASMARQTCDNITNRAFEILAGWGFDSGEVE